MTRWVLLLKIKTFVTNANQSFETEAEGFTFTFQPNAESKSEVEIIEQANDNDQSDEDAGSSIYLPSSKPTPPPSPCAPLSRPTTPPGSSPPQSEFEPEEVPTGSKRNHRSPSPEPKKVKKQITSAIRHALELSTAEVGNGQGAKHGLLKYFSKGTEEDRKAYFSREDELYNEVRLQAIVDAKNAGARKRVRERDLARERQRKHRQLAKVHEIQSGQRSPGGTKRKVSSL
jgi:hypothetical protein